MYKLFFIVLFSSSILIADDIIFKNARARLPINFSTAIYFDIVNNTNEDINIVSAKSTISNNISLRNSYVDIDGIDRRTNINKILIPCNTQISFKPQSIHIVANDLKRKFAIGEKFELILKFDNGLEKSISITIEEFN